MAHTENIASREVADMTRQVDWEIETGLSVEVQFLFDVSVEDGAVLHAGSFEPLRIGPLLSPQSSIVFCRFRHLNRHDDRGVKKTVTILEVGKKKAEEVLEFTLEKRYAKYDVVCFGNDWVVVLI